ncbi:MAG: GDP-mannose 4,6-dehydratase [Rhizobiaceae bacterium]|nr:GDP-mannose 4,6-dehydratase [Rhizobiaceae bacterium]
MTLWNGSRVLVTGGAGFIGSHLSEALVAAGASVTVFTRYASRGIGGAVDFMDPALRGSIRFIMGDLKDPSAVDAAVEGNDVVFHLAAHIGIPYSYVHPVDVVQTNVNGTLNVLEACRRHAVSKLVVFSTSEVYGTALKVPIDEDHPLQGQSPYSASKIGADQLALSYFRAFGTPVAICRPFNTYGPRQPARAIIPTIISQALRSDTIRLGSLSPTRDLVYVGDTVDGAMRIARVPEAVGSVLQLGTGVEISIGQLCETICRVLGKTPEIVSDPGRMRPGKSEVMRLIADPSRAARTLGWKPKVSLEEGIERTAAWVRGNIAFFTEGYQI